MTDGSRNEGSLARRSTRSAFPRIYVEAIRIRLRYPKGTREYEEHRHIKEIFTLKVDNATRDSINWCWGDLTWRLRSRIEIRAGSRTSLETRSDSEILAAAYFDDIHKLAVDLQRDSPWMASPLRVDFDERHILAMVTISFTVELQAPQTPTSFLPAPTSMPVNLDKTSASEPPPELSRVGYGGAYGGGFSGFSYNGPQHDDLNGPLTPAPGSPYDFDSAPAKENPYGWRNAAPVDTGKILYSVVGTQRPKPR